MLLSIPSRSVTKYLDPAYPSGMTQTQLEEKLRLDFCSIASTRLNFVNFRDQYRPTSRSRSVTPEWTQEELDEMAQAETVGHYNLLVAMGGRPHRPLRFDAGPWDSSSGRWEEYHVRAHWDVEARVCHPELKRWKAFRKYQQDIRKDPQSFPE